MRFRAPLILALLCSFALAACNSAGSGDIQDEGDLRAMLDDLPYDYTLRSVDLDRAEQAYLGRMTASNGRRLDFAISICDSDRLEEVREDYFEEAKGNAGVGPVTSLGCPTAPFPRGTGEGTVESFNTGAVSLRYPVKSPSGLRIALSGALCHAATDGEDCASS